MRIVAKYFGSFVRFVVFVALAFVCWVDVLFGSPIGKTEPASPLGILLACIITLGLFVFPWGKDWALFIACCALTCCIFVSDIGKTLTVVPPVLYAVYLAAAFSKRRNIWLVWALISVTFAGFSGYSFVRVTNLYEGFIFIFTCWLAIGFMWLLGLHKRIRDEDILAIKERAELAAVLERTHIARELHDIVGHNLTSVIALADGARFAARKNPEIAVETLETISESSREALRQVRGLVTLLRDDARPRLAPSTAGIPALIDDARASGFQLHVTGEIPKDVSPAAGFVIFRAVQELLTNMLRHSAHPSGSLIFESNSQAVKILAENDTAKEATEGAGLRGLQERVRAVDGSIRISQSQGRFIVQVVIPR